jgi:hypothetical protein
LGYKCSIKECALLQTLQVQVSVLGATKVVHELRNTNNHGSVCIRTNSHSYKPWLQLRLVFIEICHLYIFLQLKAWDIIYEKFTISSDFSCSSMKLSDTLIAVR